MNNLRILFWNSNGIAKKLNELQALASSHNIDIILLSETRINTKTAFKIPNFFTYRNDPPQKPGTPPHGGTAILVRRKIVHLPVKLDTSIQSTSIKIQLYNSELLITSVYKPPNSTLTPRDLDLLTRSADWLVSAGDFNAKHPLWHSHSTNQAGKTLFDHATINDYNILAPDSPTHFPTIRNHRPDVLDIALVKLNLHTRITNLNALSSDHNPILLEISGSPISSLPPSTNRFINWKSFTNMLQNHPCSTNPSTSNIQEIDNSIENLTTLIQTAIDNSVYKPSKNKRRHDIPLEIANEIRDKNLLRRAWQSTRDPAIKRRLNAKILFIRNILTTHKQDEWDKFLNSTNHIQNSIYKINKCLLNKRPASHPLVGPSGLVFSSSEKSELFADSLESQFTTNPGPDLPDVNTTMSIIQNCPLTNHNTFTTPGMVLKLITRQSKKKAPGEDKITNTALKFLPKNFILALTKIYNSCLKYSYFPTAWKKAVIINILKPGKDPAKTTSYRPIALLSSLSKIFERIILVNLQHSLTNKIRPEQSAFRREHSTTQQLVNLVDQIAVNMNNRKHTASVFIDVEKAFDRVWHGGLLHKMFQMNLPTYLIKIIESFLSNRTFKTRVDDLLSSPRPIRAGVPQGSCLAPTLYLIFTNDVPLLRQVKISLFADDTMFHTNNNNKKMAILRLQKQLSLAADWFAKWRLKINETKTIAVFFSNAQTPESIKLIINNTPINWSPSVKYLGVTIGRQLNFNHHITNMATKATMVRRILYPIINHRSPVPLKTRLNLIKMYITPIITYAGAAWAPFLKQHHWRKLEAIQTICIRLLTNTPKYVRNEVLLNTYHFSKIETSIRQQSLSFFFKNSLSTHQHISELGRSTTDSLPSSTKRIYKTRPLAWIHTPNNPPSL